VLPADQGPGPDVSSVNWQLVNHYRPPQSSPKCLCSVCLFLIVTSSASPLAHNSVSRPPYVQCPDCYCETSTGLCACRLLRLPPGRRLSAIHLSIISRPPLRPWPVSLLRNAVQHCFLLQDYFTPSHLNSRQKPHGIKKQYTSQLSHIFSDQVHL
jgi:hypothetical protein